MISVTSLAGKPTAVRTITMVTRPALGTPAAPILATVAVMLRDRGSVEGQRDATADLNGCRLKTGTFHSARKRSCFKNLVEFRRCTFDTRTDVGNLRPGGLTWPDERLNLACRTFKIMSPL